MSQTATQQQPQNIISTAHGKDKVIDIRDGLWLPKNYAEVTDGGIPLFLCDYSKGTGDKSVTVKAQLDPFRFKLMKEIVVKNLGTVTFPMEGAVSNVYGNILKILAGQTQLVNSLMKTMASQVKGEFASEKDKLCSIGKALKDTRDTVEATMQTDPLTQKVSYDYSYSQERVNPYKEHDGICPVSSLQINRNGLRNGELSRYPWYIKITNFDAKKNSRDGKISYDPKTRTNIREAFINISDDDMYRLCDDCEHFVDIWSCSNSVKLVKEAMVQKANNQGTK